MQILHRAGGVALARHADEGLTPPCDANPASGRRRRLLVTPMKA
jgi:hypothetical protein